MPNVFSTRKTEVFPVIALDGTGDKMTYSPGQPIDVIRWGITLTVAADVGAGAVVAMDFRPTIGSDTDRVNGSVALGIDTAGGTISFTTDDDHAIGAVIYHDVVPPFQVDPGEELVIAVDNAMDTTGDGKPFIEYLEKPFVGDSNRTAGTASNRIGNAVKKAS